LKRELREADPEDANNLATIDAMVSTHPWSESQFIIACSNPTPSRGISASENVRVLEIDDEIAGFVVYSLVLDEGSIQSIAVAPSWQGQGHAGILLQGALDILGSHGAQRCLLEVRASNTAARRLYDRFGFQQDGIRKKYYPSDSGREDALLMSKSPLAK